jgi:hypothetical protein
MLPVVLVGVVAALAAVAGCGSADGAGGDRFAAGGDWVAAARERARELARDPYDLTCRDLGRQTTQLRARITHTAETALARHPALHRYVARHTLSRAVQSIHFAASEICKRRSPEFRPAREAIAGVRSGRYRAELCVGPGC